ncbi:MAG: PaaI family thioesterase [Novosphingobium sp.]|jgi:acyl-CoA thioesterase|nr:PaaI family thioesterase [Brevundimonas sp.]MCZ8323434.1 PaaI family thioesterase [Novosphingobium sp.]
MSVDSLYETMGLVRIVEMNPEGRSRLEYEARTNQCHSGGVVQGGFVTGWIDAAMAHAVIAVLGDQVTPMSLEIKVSFFAPVRPGLVVAEGWIERRGKKTAFVEGHLLDASGNVLAKGNSTVTLFDRGKVEAAAKAAIGG